MAMILDTDLKPIAATYPKVACGGVALGENRNYGIVAAQTRCGQYMDFIRLL